MLSLSLVNASKALVMSISEEIHLLPLNDRHNSIEESDCSDSDGDVEVASDFGTEENDLIDMSTYLRIDSSEQSDTNNDDPSTSVPTIRSACSRSDSENDDYPVHSTCVSIIPLVNTSESSSFGIERSW